MVQIKLFEGSKFFWKAKCNIEFTIVLHDDIACVEVVSFNLEKYEELNRLYFSYTKLLSLILPEDLNIAIGKKKEANARSRITNVSDSALEELVKKDIIVNLITGRASVDLENKKLIVPPDVDMALITITPFNLEPYVLQKVKKTT